MLKDAAVKSNEPSPGQRQGYVGTDLLDDAGAPEAGDKLCW